MKNNGIVDFIKPTIITAQQYGTKISVEIDHSDTDISELFDAFETICLGLGYHNSSFKQWVIETAMEYNEEENENNRNTTNVSSEDALHLYNWSNPKR